MTFQKHRVVSRCPQFRSATSQKNSATILYRDIAAKTSPTAPYVRLWRPGHGTLTITAPRNMGPLSWNLVGGNDFATGINRTIRLERKP